MTASVVQFTGLWSASNNSPLSVPRPLKPAITGRTINVVVLVVVVLVLVVVAVAAAAAAAASSSSSSSSSSL